MPTSQPWRLGGNARERLSTTGRRVTGMGQSVVRLVLLAAASPCADRDDGAGPGPGPTCAAIAGKRSGRRGGSRERAAPSGIAGLESLDYERRVCC